VKTEKQTQEKKKTTFSLTSWHCRSSENSSFSYYFT